MISSARETIGLSYRMTSLTSYSSNQGSGVIFRWRMKFVVVFEVKFDYNKNTQRKYLREYLEKIQKLLFNVGILGKI